MEPYVQKDTLMEELKDSYLTISAPANSSLTPILSPLRSKLRISLTRYISNITMQLTTATLGDSVLTGSTSAQMMTESHLAQQASRYSVS